MASTDARINPFYGVAYRVIFPIMDNDGDLVTGAAALDSEISKDQGAFADCTNEATEIATSSGMYYLDISATEMEADAVAVVVKTSTVDAKTTPIVLYTDRGVRSRKAQAGGATSITLDASASATDDFYNGLFVEIVGGTGVGQLRIITDYVGSTKAATVDSAWSVNPDITSIFRLSQNGTIPPSITNPVPADVRQIVGAAVNTATPQLGVNVVNFGGSAGTFAGGRAEVNVSHWKGTAAATVDTAGYPVITIKNGTGAGEVVTASGRANANVTAIAGDTTAGTRLANFAYTVIRSNTAQSGGASTITLDAGSSAIDDFYNYTLVFIASGTGVGQARFITDYVGITKVATTDRSWATLPDNTSVFTILSFSQIPGVTAPTASEVADAVWDEARAGHVSVGTFGEGVASVQGSVTGSVASVTGNVSGSVASIAAGGITAASFGAAAITSTVVADNFITAAKINAAAIHAAAFAAGSITDTALATNVFTASKFAADAITAAALAADVTTELQSGLATAAALAAVAADLPQRITKNVNFNNFAFVMKDSTTHAPVAGKIVTTTRSIDGGAFAPCANAVVEISNGAYKINLAASDLNGDVIMLRFTAATSDDTLITIVTAPT